MGHQRDSFGTRCIDLWVHLLRWCYDGYVSGYEHLGHRCSIRAQIGPLGFRMLGSYTEHYSSRKGTDYETVSRK